MADPFAVTAGERAKHEEQFKSLGPSGGFLTGDQAKRFFLMSKLPPQVLGVIWSFSDVDGDGKLNLHEFSIACKLINLKLRGVNLPATLPPSLKQSACGGAAAATPPSGLVSVPMQQQQPMGMMMGGMAGMQQQQPVQPMMQGMGQQGMMAGMMQPMAQPMGQPMAQPVAQVMPQAMQGGVGGVAQIPSVPVGQVAPQAATAVAASPVGAAQQRRPSDGGFADWAVPQHSKLKYTQVFNMTDRTKSGFLSGVQARNILIQAQLPQQILAQIWALSDCDGDGRLSCEEFVLALYLCEQAKQGVKPPVTLPPDLIPPSQRRQRGGSVTSVGSGGGQVQQSPVQGGINTGMMINDDSFEDKRKENFDKGQAELERRRKALLDAQRRETEERLRREREEEAKREKIRMDAEKRRQEELEKEMRRQQEVEMQKEEERKRQMDMKEQAQKDAERQRQLEWEKQRLQELMNVRQRQQENLLALKAKNQSLGIEMETKEDRVKELTQKISETRIGVTEVKATIDGMRTTRDNYMTDMNQLKASARDQNQRLLALNQEKARLKARSTAAAGSAGAESAVVDATLVNKQMVIKQLQEKADELETDVKSKEEDLNNNIKDLDNLKSDMMMTADRCKELYTEFDGKRQQVLSLREKLVNPDAAWGDSGGSTWAGKGFGEGTVSGSGGWTSTAWPPTDSAWTSSGTTSHTSSEITPSTAEAADPSSASLHHLQEEQPKPAPPQQQKQQPPGRPSPVRPPPPSNIGSNSSSPLPADAFGNGSVATEAAAGSPKEAWAGDSQDTADTWGTNQANTSSFTTTTTTTALWGATPPNSTSTIQTSTTTTTSNTHTDQKSAEGDVAAVAEDGRRFRALYQFDARNEDELSFMPGDIITVTLAEGAEPGWLGGIFQGATGWFPEAYCEPCDGVDAEVAAVETVEEVTRTQLEQIPEEAADSNSVVQKTLGEALGIFPWRAKQNNHLSFNKGDRIVVKEQQDQWWYGEVNGSGGWFPHSYVRMVSGPGAVSSAATTPLEAPEEPPMPDTLINDEVSEYYMALYPYESPEDGDLTFEAGAVILVVKKEGDWWHGITDQRSGVFPSNYVQKCPSQVDTQQSSTEPIVNNVEAEEVAITGEQVEGKGKKPEIATVIAPYDATSNNQLNLSRGQLIMIRKKTPSGWWEGELQARGKKRQIGWFPASYVKVLGGSSRSTPTSMELTNREDAPPPDLETPGSQSGDKVINTSVIENNIEDSGDQTKSNGGVLAVEALYPYAAMNDDELNFEAGAIITVLDKEDEAWWKGQLNGVTGMFPSNYVAQLAPGGVSLANATGTPDAENFDSLC